MDMQRDDPQLELFGQRQVRGGNSGIGPEHRYYFTLLPPPALAQDIEAYAGGLVHRHRNWRPTSAGRLHVSLNGVHRGGPMDADDINDALAVGASIRRSGFDLAFDR